MPGDGDDGSTPRKTKLYGAAEPYPPTIDDSWISAPAANPVTGSHVMRYRVGELLGRGGMGEVISARDDQIGRSVAIKRLRVESPSPDVIARFLREARIQGRLEHPAVVPVHELWQDDAGQPFFVMKQVSGTTLADVLPQLVARDRETSDRFTRQRLLRAFADVCLAIEFAHTRGVVHRDLKPANIVLGEFGEVYVLDWGIARVAGDDTGRSSFSDIDTAHNADTVAGSILGTPGYISPEQIHNTADLDGRADVYALGCLLFEMLTLEPLHPRGQPGLASALAGAADARPSIRAPEREIPPELDAICIRATALDREERFATARQLGDAVQRFLDGNRDVALRKELARTELAAAHAALAGGPTAAARRTAIRAAARALALDPTTREAAELVGRLMLEPPREVPPEVDAELERLDHQALRTSARFGMLAAFAYLAFFPILYWVGIRETWFFIAGPAVCTLIILVEVYVAPRNPYLSGYIAIPANLLMFALFSWMVSPIVIGPGPATIMVMLLAAHRTLIPPAVLAALTAIATISPWLFDLAHLVPARTTIAGRDIIMHTEAATLDPTATSIGLALYIVTLIFMAALLARLQDDERRTVRRTHQLQAWQLRQLIPRPTSLPVD
jgi:eukaryotic-like serine/threonine-protein kinase